MIFALAAERNICYGIVWRKGALKGSTYIWTSMSTLSFKGITTPCAKSFRSKLLQCSTNSFELYKYKSIGSAFDKSSRKKSSSIIYQNFLVSTEKTLLMDFHFVYENFLQSSWFTHKVPLDNWLCIILRIFIATQLQRQFIPASFSHLNIQLFS